jgi:hypothetical protein
MPAGRYARTAFLGWIQGDTMPAAPSSVWLHLCTAAPADAETPGTAPTITGYAPQEIEPADWAAISEGASVDTLSPSDVVTFGPFSGETQNATHAMLMTGSNPVTAEILAYGALAASRAMVDGGTIEIAAGDLDVTA